jgi:hypothetical protein
MLWHKVFLFHGKMNRENQIPSIDPNLTQEAVAQNPNPRANENIRSGEEENPDDSTHRTEGPGTEITDGEAG